MDPIGLIKDNLHRIEEKKILFVGIGNVLKSDDGVGVYISKHIHIHNNISVLTVEVSIENYIGKINSLDADILVLLDCMDFQKPPGYWELIPVSRLKGHTTNTHNISLAQVSELFNAPAYILGVQPNHLQFGENLSPEVKTAAHDIISQINQLA
jgi:hydrogenase maturation protease